MKRKIAIEDSLTQVSSYLKSQGYDVTSLNNNNLNNCEAVIVSGQDNNFMGMEDTLTKAQVVDAAGKTPEEIYNQLKNTLR